MADPIQCSVWHRNRLFAILMLIPILLLAGPVSAETVPIETWWQLLSEIRANLANGESIDDAINQLADIDTLRDADGSTLSIDNAALITQLTDELESDDPTADKLALLDAWLQLADLETASEQADAEQELESILARPEFQYEEEESWFQKQGRRFFNWLFSVLPEFDSRGAAVWGWGTAATAGIILLLLIGYWARGLRGQFSAEISLPATSDADYDLSAGQALDRAQTLADSGDYREAVRYLYLSTLLSLDDRGQLRFDRSKTNREYLRQVANSDFAPTLGSVINVFDRVWYGFQPIDAATYATYATRVEELVR